MKLIINNVRPKNITQNNAALSDVWGKELLLNKGEIYFVHAPSGRGKSTFIHFLYGLRDDYEGTISWDDKELSLQDENQWATWRSSKLSIVFQDLRLFPELSLWDNICVKQSLTGAPPLSAAKDWLKAFGLGSKLEQPAGQLSYGERQRVAIVRALAQPFCWLLLDEPFSHLDDGNIQKAVHIMETQIAKQNAGVIIADVKDRCWFAGNPHRLLL